MLAEYQMQLKLIYAPEKGETPESALPEILRSMADGLEEGRRAGGAPNGGHWSVNINGK